MRALGKLIFESTFRLSIWQEAHLASLKYSAILCSKLALPLQSSKSFTVEILQLLPTSEEENHMIGFRIYGVLLLGCVHLGVNFNNCSLLLLLFFQLLLERGCRLRLHATQNCVIPSC